MNDLVSSSTKVKPLKVDIDLCQTMIDALSGTIKDPTIDVNAQILLSKELREWVALKHKIKE